jgi:RNA polymerase sigma-70 factor (ECF subfamily)
MTLRRLREGSVRDPERITSFVLGACRQSVVDWRRGERRRERLLEHFAAEFGGVTEDATPVDVEQLRRCMECLPERERSVLLLSFFEERPAAEVAAELQLSPANIRVIRHRGIERLRECMNREGH